MVEIDVKKNDNCNSTDVKLPLPPPPRLTCTSKYTTAAEESSPAAAAAAASCYSPHLILSRWLHRPTNEGEAAGCRVRFPRRCGKKKRKEGEEREKVASPPRQASDWRTKDRQPAMAELAGSSSLGRKPEELSSNLGLSMALVFLLARGATEINKMSEMRRQMEALVKDIKDEFQSRASSSSFIASNHHRISYSAANFSETENSRKSIQVQNYRALVRMVSDREKRNAWPVHLNGGLKMDQMEAELEIELERMQLQVAEQTSSSVIQDHYMKQEEASKSDSSNEGSSVSYVEETEDKEEDKSKYCGVSPRELERRLHELLEAQQQERIQELERALEHAERKLRERDIELCWWRDTEKLAPRHKDGILLR